MIYFMPYFFIGIRDKKEDFAKQKFIHPT